MTDDLAHTAADGLSHTLSRIVEIARDSIGAHYAALSVLDHRREQIEHLSKANAGESKDPASGLRQRTGDVIGNQLLLDPRPLRLTFVPVDDPVVFSFLGVPILIDGTPWGALYLEDKHDGLFNEVDEHAATALALAAAKAVQIARWSDPVSPTV